MSRKRILLVEDDQGIAEVESDYLTANGFVVDIAYDGNQGCEKALQGDYDLLLLDIMLPGKDGFAICREVRAVKDTPILMVSAKREDIDKIRGLGLGADDYIVKPFSPNELVARVKAHIARYERLTGGRNTGDAMIFGDLEIRRQERRVFLAGREISLKNREFDLLLFLAENPGLVFSKDSLFERIWGLEAMGDTATVTVHINRIREKIEPKPSEPRYVDKALQTGNTNFALLVSKHFSEPFKDSNGYGESIARLSNMLGGGVLVQRFGDLVRGRRSTQKRMDEGFVTPTLAAAPGDLSLVLPKRILDGIIEMIYALDKIAPGTANDDTLLYGVEVKFYNMEVELDDNLECRYKGLYIIGDGSGVTHSLSHASASGVFVARKILADM
mgnify:CR=1 FL=1